MTIHTEQDTEEGNINTQTQYFDADVANCNFKDKRLKDRFRKLLEQIWHGVGQTIPLACQDWANTKAAYRFLSKERVTAQKEGIILVLQDTTEVSYHTQILRK